MFIFLIYICYFLPFVCMFPYATPTPYLQTKRTRWKKWKLDPKLALISFSPSYYLLRMKRLSSTLFLFFAFDEKNKAEILTWSFFRLIFCLDWNKVKPQITKDFFLIFCLWWEKQTRNSITLVFFHIILCSDRKKTMHVRNYPNLAFSTFIFLSRIKQWSPRIP